MQTIKTTQDGWDCAPSLRETTRVIDDFGHLFYEIKNCRRAMTAEEMVTELRYFVECIDEAVSQAESDLDGVEFQTIEED